MYLLVLLALAIPALAQYGAPRVLADVRISGLKESSGVAASRAHPGLFWSHNDSGGGAWLYAFDRSGKSRGRWKVPSARASDWEDIAIGPGPKRGVSYLYIGDIGDNQSSRKFVTVYRIPEPDPDANAGETARAESFRLRYPDGAHDAEALLVHPKTGDLYIVTKARGSDSETLVFKAAAPLAASKVIEMKKTTAVRLTASLFTMLIGGVTGGEISPDGTRVVLCDYLKAWEAVLPKGGSFDSVWRAEWREIDLGGRKQGEAVCYRHDGRAVIATSEGAEFPLIEVVRK